ncbi:ribosomal protein S18-alanine N-acetyltransferase [Xenophilus arseniciresistens]|uniref:[Ribosomal protein bS18]-alanine N-acetyltransferase n=1 Tax=Xenophilus arseniciresistens TaxID=1283306 RepID=A0AAE3T386_9BURK|nr:ribosomal protein S18-alanine N-acetyltransferase [Xenophilus arseniciresistens]MDA7419212.1 ribosomal protein S18-alanine N-acetyltransferase [Xenophilus arseniciresistens]
MSAVHASNEARLESMHAGHLDRVLDVEERAYSHPWTRGNFLDSMRVGYHCQCLIGPAAQTLGAAMGTTADTLIGYFVAMKGVDEVHLLNITVAPAFQRQGWAALMLAALTGWSRGQQAHWLWLEVRVSNSRAQDLYERHGFRRVGVRKNYYPAPGDRREDAIVMSLRLQESPSAWGGLLP